MLQKFCEMMENAQILERAAESDDSAMRAALVLVFNAAKYSSIQFRTLKPFNPILGETYEYSCPDFRFLAEQVSHHPPITACHTYGKGYEFWDNSQMKSKFWGKSLEFIPESNFYCVFGDEHYVCKKPSTVANNLIFGTLYLDCGGASVCHCPQTGIKGELKFKSKGIWNRTLGQVEGYVSDSAGNKLLRIDGLWTEKISITNLETEEETVVWEIDEKPDNFEDQHSFSKFCINLNNLTPKLEGEIAPTDSRFRTDLREFERGDIDKGAEEKHRLEEKQRAARKDRKDNGETWSPLWFEEVIEEETGDKFFKINDKYWQKKQEGDWSECPDLF